jgi:CubicO group peptidase (beta-lactamase class C family)
VLDHAVVTDAGIDLRGDGVDRVRPWASVTKALFALAAWIAVEEGTLDLDEPAGPAGSTVRHLLAHASGLAFEGGAVIGRPGARRIYSNEGIEVAAGVLERRTGMPWWSYAREAVCEPLGMATIDFRGSAAAGARGSVRDLSLLAAELRSPTLVAPTTWALATSVAFPGLPGVLPGFGRQRENDWGLGVEIKGTKSPHWTPPEASTRTFGHFGRSGSFVWVDPVAGVALASLADEPFDDWAREAWPALGSSVLREA